MQLKTILLLMNPTTVSGYFEVDKQDYPKIILKNRSNQVSTTNGIYVNTDPFLEVGETVTISYDFTVNNGTIYRVGGHAHGFDTLSLEIDGVKRDGSWSSDRHYADSPYGSFGDRTHTVVVTLRRIDHSDDRLFVLQPNRGEFSDDYEITIDNLEIVRD